MWVIDLFVVCAGACLRNARRSAGRRPRGEARVGEEWRRQFEVAPLDAGPDAVVSGRSERHHLVSALFPSPSADHTLVAPRIRSAEPGAQL